MTELQYERNSEMISEGIHYLRQIDVTEDIGDKGPYFWIRFQVHERSDDNGKEIRTVVSTSPAARWKVDEYLDAVGAPPQGSGHPSVFNGTVVRAKIEHEERDGRMRETVASLLPAGSAGGQTPAQPSAPPPTSPPPTPPSPAPQQGQDAGQGDLPVPPPAAAPSASDDVPF